MDQAEFRELELFESSRAQSLDLTLNPIDGESTTASVLPLHRHSSFSTATIDTPKDGTDTKRSSYTRMQSLYYTPLNAFQAHKRRSRYHGWQWGILIGACSSGIVLILNIAFAIVGACTGSGYQGGIATLYTGNTPTVSRASTLLHMLINLLSTCLLSASNYAMQVLSAPTRSECDNAHKKGKWLEIGVPSVQNMLTIKGRRRALWIILALSSVPLHLFYNASVFQVIAGNDYSVRFVSWSTSEGPLTPEFDPENKLYSLLTPSQLKERYSSGYVSGYGDMTIGIDRVRVEWPTPYFERIPDRNRTTNVPGINLSRSFYFSSSSEGQKPSKIWSKFVGNDGWAKADQIAGGCTESGESRCTLWDHNTSDQADEVMVRITRASVKKAAGESAVQLSLPFLFIVIGANMVKIACLLIMLLVQTTEHEPPLVTIGDAIASFLRSPDSSTSGACIFSREEFFWKTGYLKRSAARQVDGRAAETDRRCEGYWEQTWPQYISAISLRKKVCLILGALTVPIGLAPLFMFGPLELSSWGSESQKRIAGYEINSNATAKAAFFANAPQLLISLVYLYFNSMFTSMALAHEYNQTGKQRKGLRVTKPEGEQRETYFLQLPLKYGIPLNVLSGLLHWLTSQTLFLVRFDQFNRAGQRKISESEAGCGFSSSALLALILVLFVLGIAVASFGLITFEAHVPFAGSCSWVISAACHPSPTEQNPDLKKVSWGVIEDSETAEEGIGHCSFSGNDVKKPVEGMKYR